MDKSLRGSFFSKAGTTQSTLTSPRQGSTRSLMARTDYTRPDLRKHYPGLWGRDLDNHYDPQVHHRSFLPSPKSREVPPVTQGTYQKRERVKPFQRFLEFEDCKANEMMISIEHW